MQAGLISRRDDYEYIDRFIDFLERIINIILKLFGKIGDINTKTTATEATTPSNAVTSTDG